MFYVSTRAHARTQPHNTQQHPLDVRMFNHECAHSHNRRTKLVTAKVLSRWSSRKNEQHRMRNLMSKLVRRMQNAGISQAWQTWREYVHSVLGARKQEERRSRIMKRSLLKILNARMCMVMAKWKNAIKKTFRLRTVATKAILR